MAISAITLFKLITILPLLLISFHLQIVLSTPTGDGDRYILDTPFIATHRLRSRFLASIRKGNSCDPDNSNNVCNGVSADNGKSLLQCCIKSCRDVFNDVNNCGRCGRACKLTELCCDGTCIDPSNASHSGKCHNSCSSGNSCENGFCSYAT